MQSATFYNLQVLIRRLAFLLLLYTLCRLIFYAFNSHYFSALGFSGLIPIIFYGIYFDASTIILLNFLFLVMVLLPFPFREGKVYKGVVKWMFYIINSIALLSNCTDFVYFQFTTKRTTADVFNFFGGSIGNDLGRLLPLFLKDYWYVLIIWAALTWLMVKAYKRADRQPKPLVWNARQYIRQTLILIITFGLALIVYRGGLQLRPIGIVNAGEYTDSKNVPLLLNTPFSILKSLEVQGIEPVIYFTDEAALKKEYNPYHPAKTGEFKKLNVFIIALESFSKEYVGALNGRNKGYTPFLDSLISQSLTFSNAFSNGKKSIEGIPAIVASIPTWTNEPFITSRYGGNQITSLASILKAEGYNTSFYHGGTNGTMGFDAFAKLAGYDNYYGRSEYNNEKDYDGNWGIWDEEFLQYTAQSVNKKPQPFFATLFTLSSHHPYPMPEKYLGKFPDGPLESERTISYSDYALKRFFESASRMPWFKNTLFVLSADHTGISRDAFYTNRIGNFSIPIIYYMPGSSLKGLDSTITQQIDIMPSILDYLNYNKPYFAYGNSVFDTTGSHYALTFNNESFQLFENYYTSEFGDGKRSDLYYYKTDSFLLENLAAKRPLILKRMETKTKAIIQTYQQSIINNKMH